MRCRSFSISVLLLILSSLLISAPTAQAWGDDDPRSSLARGELFDAVAETLMRGFHDKGFRENVLPALAEEWRDDAHAATSFEEEKRIVDSFLAEIPASHLALLSREAHDAMLGHLMNRSAPTVGFELIHLEDGYFVHGLLEGGPGERAGAAMGDRVVSIDGVEPSKSSRLDWSSDDPALPDPGIHAILCEEGETIPFVFERTPAERAAIDMNVESYSAFEAAKKSVRVIESGEHAIGYLHLHYIHMTGPDKILADAINGPLKECDAIILDLRGRGGNAMMVGRIVNVLTQLKRKRGTVILALIDQNTRSAKEAISWELRDRNLATLVGETTAGALLPASFRELPGETVLMYPAFKLGKFTEAIEGIGVEPHIPVEPKRAYTNGHDPLIETAVRAAPKLIEEAAARDT